MSSEFSGADDDTALAAAARELWQGSRGGRVGGGAANNALSINGYRDEDSGEGDDELPRGADFYGQALSPVMPLSTSTSPGPAPNSAQSSGSASMRPLELQEMSPSPQKNGRVYRNKEVRLAFRQAASNHNDEITLHSLPEVLHKLDLTLDAAELSRRFPYDENHLITYDEFIGAMGDVLFGFRAKPFDLGGGTTSAPDSATLAVDDTPVNKLSRWMSDLLSIGRDALMDQPMDESVLQTDDIDDTLLEDDDPVVSRPLIDDQQLLKKMQDASEAERQELRRDRALALERLQMLNDDLGLSEHQYMSLQAVAEATVESFRIKQQELDRYKDLTADLIQRLRHRTTLDSKPNAVDPAANVSHSTSLLQKLQGQLDELNAAVQNNPEAAPILQRCRQTVVDAIEATVNEASMRRGIAEDNGWLWMQVTQLQKQMEQNFTARTAKSDASSASQCTIS